MMLYLVLGVWRCLDGLKIVHYPVEGEDLGDDRFLLTRIMISNKTQICAWMNRGAPKEEI